MYIDPMFVSLHFFSSEWGEGSSLPHPGLVICRCFIWQMGHTHAVNLPKVWYNSGFLVSSLNLFFTPVNRAWQLLGCSQWWHSTSFCCSMTDSPMFTHLNQPLPPLLLKTKPVPGILQPLIQCSILVFPSKEFWPCNPRHSPLLAEVHSSSLFWDLPPLAISLHFLLSTVWISLPLAAFALILWFIILALS